MQSIIINGVSRTYYETGNKKSNKILLVFHGGGENAGYGENGILGYSGLNEADAIVLSFNGQKSNNGQTWINAFPWLIEKSSYDFYNENKGGLKSLPDDVLFVKTVLNKYPNNYSIYATGKSDGAGFVAFIIALFLDDIPIKAAATCSMALFYTKFNEPTPPPSIGLPKLGDTPFLELHGTKDTVMPFNGQQFTTAPSSTIWQLIDPTMKDTYTMGPYDWLLKENPDQNPKSETLSNNNQMYKWSNNILIAVNNGDHDWFGHENSEPNSSSEPNLSINATSVILKFLNIGYSKGQNQSYLKTIPTYNNISKENYSNQYGMFMTLAITTSILSLLFMIWSIIIIIRCSKSKKNQPLLTALIIFLILSLFLSWIPGLGQFLTLGLLITVIIGTIQC